MSNREFLAHLGVELKIARIRMSLTQANVASKTGLSVMAISKIETGQRDGHILTYKRIADVLGVELKQIL
jgi:transcriptional regulator with XRE-family HTH domain